MNQIPKEDRYMSDELHYSLVNIGTDPVGFTDNLIDQKNLLIEERKSINKEIAWIDSLISMLSGPINKKKKK